MTEEFENYRKEVIAETDKFTFREGSANQKFFLAMTKGKSYDEIKAEFGYDDKRMMLTGLYLSKRNKPKKVKAVQTQLPVQDSVENKTEIVVGNRDKFIPHNNGYIPRKMNKTTDLKLMQQLYANKHFVLIVGETGSGKTHLARDVAYKNKAPYMRVNVNGATTPEDLVGQWIPNPNNGSDAKYIWQDGVLTDFMKHGGIFVVDEINMCPADILSLFHSITDDERRLVLTQKDGEVITAHEDFYFVATMNPDYQGTKELNLALKDRFRVMFLTYNDAVEKKLKVDKEIHKIAKSIRKSDEITTPVSTRDLIKYTQDKTMYGEDIGKMFFLNNFETMEQFVVKELMKLNADEDSMQDSEDQN